MGHNAILEIVAARNWLDKGHLDYAFPVRFRVLTMMIQAYWAGSETGKVEAFRSEQRKREAERNRR